MDEPQDAQLFLGEDDGECAACLCYLLFKWNPLILDHLEHYLR